MTNDAAPSFSVVVPTFRRPETLWATLGGLLAQDYPAGRYELIVVDDGADEAVRRIVERAGRKGVALKLEVQHRRGAAAARNLGARVAGGELVLFCDDDMLVPPSHLRAHSATHCRHADAVVGGTWELSPSAVARLGRTPFGRYRLQLEQRFRNQARGQRLDGHPSLLRVPVLSAANLSLRRDLFWLIGGFDEDFPFAGAEDQDLSLRARAAHAHLLLDTDIRCVHNDNHLSRRAYCEREERNARTMPFLVRKHPAEFASVPYARVNRPIAVGDAPSLIAKKLLKAALASTASLALLHGLAGIGEAVRAPERILRRLYTGLIALHLFRGFRRSWACETGPLDRDRAV